MTAFHPLPEALRTALFAAADPQIAPQMQAYMKSEMPFLGIHTPTRKQLYREAWKAHPVRNPEEYEWVVRNLWELARHREERYAALATAERYANLLSPEMLPLLQEMIITGAWWDYVDLIAANLVGRLLRSHPAELKPLLRRWIESDNLWIRRTAILSQLRHKESTDSEMLFTFCDTQLEDTSFWIRKAIGWALREYSKCDPKSVRRFIDDNGSRMSGLTRREASKYV